MPCYGAADPKKPLRAPIAMAVIHNLGKTYATFIGFKLL
jgi:hypothetical protein